MYFLSSLATAGISKFFNDNFKNILPFLHPENFECEASYTANLITTKVPDFTNAWYEMWELNKLDLFILILKNVRAQFINKLQFFPQQSGIKNAAQNLLPPLTKISTNKKNLKFLSSGVGVGVPGERIGEEKAFTKWPGLVKGPAPLAPLPRPYRKIRLMKTRSTPLFLELNFILFFSAMFQFRLC